MKRKIIVHVLLLCLLLLTACGQQMTQTNEQKIQKTGSMELEYANQFQVDYYEGGYAHIMIEDGNDYVLIPENAKDTDLGFADATLLHAPLDSVYLAATAAMDLFRQLDALDAIKACSTKAQDYEIPEARERIEKNQILYVGKYSAPEYEMLLGMDCRLAVESTMIYHAPKVKEQLEELGIPVLVERSSYESHPLGRLEWIKLYGLLMGKQDEAEHFFDAQANAVRDLTKQLEDQKDTDSHPKVVVFYVSSNGYLNVRKPGDYLTKMIAIAGGEYALAGLEIDEENALSTINITWEDFYKEAVDADILVYNGTIDGGVKDLDDLISKNALFEDFRAVRQGQVYCTNMNMFQETGKIAEVIQDFHHIIEGNDSGCSYLKKLR